MRIAEVKHRNYILDIIRIVAMTGVLMIHLTIYLPIPENSRWLFLWGG